MIFPRIFDCYEEGDFRRVKGLVVDKMMLVVRPFILVDKKGIVRYIQVVSEITRFPDIDRAFQRAIEVCKEP